jgi:hypothetical protein
MKNIVFLKLKKIYKTIGGEPRLDKNIRFLVLKLDVVDVLPKFKQIKKINLLMIFV